MKAKRGDRIIVESEKAATASRSGVVEEVLQKDPPRLRVRWDDGRTTILTPAAGVAKIAAAKGERTPNVRGAGKAGDRQRRS